MKPPIISNQIAILIYSLKAQRRTYRQIANYLNKHGHRTPSLNLWTKDTVGKHYRQALDYAIFKTYQEGGGL